MTAFASYAFNKSHAAAYGVVAVQTAWLKAHHPVEFMAALMNSVTGNTDKVAFYIDTCKRLGIRVLPPDVGVSEDGFSVERSQEKAIRFGLGAVKNVGHGAVRAIIDAREKPYRDLYDFVARACCDQVNKKAAESLIMAGALDYLPGARAQKLGALEKAIDGAAKKRKNTVEGQCRCSARRRRCRLRRCRPRSRRTPGSGCGWSGRGPACTYPATRWTNIRKSWTASR
jgi:DNA polymerase-3 subunit alpha